MFSAVHKYIRYLFHPLVLILAALVFFALVRYLDTRWRFMPYTLASTLAIAAVLFLVSRRFAFSLYAAGVVVMLLATVSTVKFRLKGFALHAYDFVFLGGDASVIRFLWEHYTSLLVAGMAVLAGGVVVLAALFLADRPWRVQAGWRSIVAGVAVGGAVLAYPPPRAEEPPYLPYIDGYNASSFFVSIADISFPFDRIELSSRLENVTADRPLEDRVSCGAPGARPDVVLVLSESQTAPSYIPEFKAPDAVARSFHSADGALHPLYVETFGGGTWVSNFSALTGLSSADMGWQASYVTQLMQGRIKGSLADVLSRCGYRTVAVMPMLFSFVNEGNFLTSLGFQEVFDAKDMGLEPRAQRDRVYFDFVNALIERHRESDDRPLFIAMQTLFPHAPYTESMVPISDLAPETFAPDPAANEYMRRVIMSRADFQAFLEARRASPGKNGSVVFEFGDHQTEATKPYIEKQMAGKPLFLDYHSPIYKTYVTFHGMGMPVDPAPFDKPQDIGFLPASLIEAAGLPTSPTFQDLSRLRDVCSGRFHTCQQRSSVDAHLKARADAGLILVD